jgi:uncharacterized membrane protein YozB (DUF420 family)
MSDLLNSTAPLSSDISMILQLLALGIILLGFAVVKRRNLKVHGFLMLLTTLVNTVSILVVMIPVALNLGSISIPGFNFLFRTHIILGILVESVAVYIVADWRFQNPGPTCIQRKNWMLTLSIFWIAQLLIGMLLYMRLYH